MKKFRTYKKYTVIYQLEKEDMAYRISIEKDGVNGYESSSYVVNGKEKDLKALLCRLWACGVTPMSLVYILEDEGYIPCGAEEESEIKSNKIVKRKHACVGKTIEGLSENENADKTLVAVGGKGEECE